MIRHLLVAVFGLSLLSPAIAQDNPPESAATVKSLENKLTELLQRRRALLNRLSQLKKTYAEADAVSRTNIEAQFNEAIAELWDKNQPQTLQVAQQIIEKDPANLQAAEILIQELYSRNQYKKVIATSEKLLATGNSSAMVLNLCGAAYFATQQFDKAKQILEKASEKGGPLFQQVGGLYLQSCDNYKSLWEREQKLRAEEKQADNLPRVQLKTSRGNIVVELFENEAPNTVANFINLVQSDFYDGTQFHRVIPNFMAQGGDPNSKDADPSNDGSGGPGYTIDCECYMENARHHFQGSLSMAHAGKDTGGSQFFLTHLPTSHLNPKKGGFNGPSGHTVFGRVIEGLDIALSLEKGDSIETATVLRKRDHDYKPVKN